MGNSAETKTEAGGDGSQPDPPITKIQINDEADWDQPPKVSFNEKASLNIAYLIIGIFGGVYFLSFLSAFLIFGFPDATFEKSAELVKFFIQSTLPLVTLAVGYYLGDKSKP